MSNADPIELEKFSQLAHKWWDPNSEFKPLHQITPLRLGYIDRAVSLAGKTVLDVGCGGGILSEALADAGATVTGIDLADKSLSVAKLHLLESGKQVEYRKVAAESLAEERPAHYDVVTCMEMLEHVPDPAAIVAACAKLVKPGGHVFFSTLNRNPKSYLFAIIGAEYVLNFAAARHPRLRQVHQTLRIGAMVPQCRTWGKRGDGHELQPAGQVLLARTRHQRQLFTRQPTWLMPSSSISTARLALRDLAPLPLEVIRPQASHGSRGLLKLGLGIEPGAPDYEPLREAFLQHYQAHLCDRSKVFPGISALVAELDQRDMPWGIVTNKPHRYTVPLVEKLGYATRAACLVSGDTCAEAKPHPAPLLYAAELMGVDTRRCLYLGDDLARHAGRAGRQHDRRHRRLWLSRRQYRIARLACRRQRADAFRPAALPVTLTRRSRYDGRANPRQKDMSEEENSGPALPGADDIQAILHKVIIAHQQALALLQQTETAYSRLVPHQLLSLLQAKSIVDVKLGDQVERKMTILFSDIRDFTQLSETMTPAENFEFINSYLSQMEPVISRHHGIIDKYIGDAIMALFAKGADEALRGAIGMLERRGLLQRGTATRGLPADPHRHRSEQRHGNDWHRRRRQPHG